MTDIKKRLDTAILDLSKIGATWHVDICRDALAEIERLELDLSSEKLNVSSLRDEVNDLNDEIGHLNEQLEKF
jgi:predicted  nucleic acid-binding Zn-ribbon protein